MNRLQSIQLATDLKDECKNNSSCYSCKLQNVCVVYLEVEPCNMPILEIAQIIREVEKENE